MSVAYKVKDINFMNNLKNKVNQLNYNAYAEKDFDESFNKMFVYLLFDDLNNFLRTEYENNSLPYLPDYFYNYNISSPDVMFVTTTNNPMEIEILKNIIKAKGITNYYITSYCKTDKLEFLNFNHNDLDIVLNNEIKNVKPKKIIFFGNRSCGNLQYLKDIDKHKKMSLGNCNFIITSSLLDLLSVNLDNKSKIVIKNLIWNDFNNMSL